MSGIAGRQESVLERDADVLVVGGGPAAAWAALTAREEGARVILVDKGYCGTSGVAAASTIGHWWVEPSARGKAMAEKDAAGGNLSEFDWMERVLEETWRSWPRIASKKGYVGGGGALRGMMRGQPIVQGPVYLREMRRLLRQAGVEILDHSPALELLMRDDAVRGAAGVQRQAGRHWRISAAGVVLATGGCTFKSGCLGGNTNAGDGYLMAVEAGARLSGLEFSNYYGLVPVGGSVDKNGYFLLASYFDAAGREIERGWSPPAGVMGTRLAHAFLAGPVFARFTQVEPAQHLELRANQPNLFIQFDRMGIDPFAQRFAIEPMMEGSVRGTGGVEIVDGQCWTGVEGLWVAGDTASRERITGAASGAGSPNAAWTISSGRWSGAAAAQHALGKARAAKGRATAIGKVGLRPRAAARAAGDAAGRLLGVVHQEILPLEKNGLRSANEMTRSLDRLDAAWDEASAIMKGDDVRSLLCSRETAAMLAVARWSYLAALERRESRGMHRRSDFQDRDPRQRNRILISGIDQPQLRRSAIVPPVAAASSLLSTS